MITLELSGIDEVTRELALRLSVSRARDFFGPIASSELHQIMKVSQDIVPYLTGFLHDSAYETLGFGSGDRIDAEGGYTADYAVPVHEDLSKRHPKGTALYLLIPWKKFEAGGLDKFAKQAEKHFIQGVQGKTGFYVRRGRLR